MVSSTYPDDVKTSSSFLITQGVRPLDNLFIFISLLPRILKSSEDF